MVPLPPTKLSRAGTSRERRAGIPVVLAPCCPSLPSHPGIPRLHHFPRRVILSKSLSTPLVTYIEGPTLSVLSARELVAMTFQKMHACLAHITC